MAAELVYRGALRGHSNWVTSIATSAEQPDMIVTGSRDKTLIVWQLTRDVDNYGIPRRSLTGHSHFVQDVAISSDGQFALSGSWDGSLRLWDLSKGATIRRFVGHTKDVLSVAFSADNRQIFSASRDRTVKLWNTLGECKMDIVANGHQDWVSCVRFAPHQNGPLIVTAGWDKVVKVWNLTTCQLERNLTGHEGFLNTITVSPDGSLCASGGREGRIMLWDLSEGKPLYSLEAGDVIHALVFSPNRYWLVAATESKIKIWDLESKKIVAEPDIEFNPESKKALKPFAASLAWSSDGSTLFAGYTDSTVRVWSIV